MAKTDISETYRIAYNMLRITGGWPKENSSTIYRIWGAIVYSLSGLLTTTMFIAAYYDRHDYVKLSETQYVIVMIMVYCFKHAGVFANTKSFIDMIKLMDNPVFQSYTADLDALMEKRVKFSRTLARIYNFTVFLCLGSNAISPFIDNKPLPYPFPYELGSYRIFMYIFQVIASISGAWNNSALDILNISVTGLAITQLEILAKKISVAGYKEEQEERDDSYKIETLRQNVEHHLTLIEFVECIDTVFSFAILSQFIASVLIICNTLIHFLLIPIGSSHFITLVSFLAIAVSQLFMYCWFGNEISWNSLQIQDACYASNWYNSGKAIGRFNFIIMERSKRPLKVTAYKFSTVSLSAFMSIMQWSYSYFALLMNMYNKK